jgi:hypothetical protein
MLQFDREVIKLIVLKAEVMLSITLKC